MGSWLLFLGHRDLGILMVRSNGVYFTNGVLVDRRQKAIFFVRTQPHDPTTTSCSRHGPYKNSFPRMLNLFYSTVDGKLWVGEANA